MKTAATERIHVNQGGHCVADQQGVWLSAVLGSCVALCLHDDLRRIGGMNHFLLPEGDPSGVEQGRRYGVHLCELLINDLMQQGADRRRLKAKVFGGAHIVQGLRDIGASNAQFILRFLADEGIPIVGRSLRGVRARRVEFEPTTGRAFQRFVVIDDQELLASSSAHAASATTDVELF